MLGAAAQLGSARLAWFGSAVLNSAEGGSAELNSAQHNSAQQDPVPLICARLSSTRLSSAGLCSENLSTVQFSSAWLHSAQIGPAQLGSAWQGAASLGSAWLGNARHGSVWHNMAQHGTAHPIQPRDPSPPTGTGGGPSRGGATRLSPPRRAGGFAVPPPGRDGSGTDGRRRDDGTAGRSDPERSSAARPSPLLPVPPGDIFPSPHLSGGEKRGAASGPKGRAHRRCPALTAPCPHSAAPCLGRCCELRSDGLSSSLPSTPPAQMQWIIFMLLLFISSMEMLSQNRWKKQGREGAVHAGDGVCRYFCSQLDAGGARGAKPAGRMLGGTAIPCPIPPLGRESQGTEQGALRCVPSAGQCPCRAVT